MNGLEVDDEIEQSTIVVPGMSAESFDAQHVALSRGFDPEDEDGVPGAIIMKADYDNVRVAIGDGLGQVTDQNQSVADMLVFIMQGARVASRVLGMPPERLTFREISATEKAMAIKIEPA